MSVTSKSPKDVLFVAWRIAQQSLKPYSHLYSPKKFTQHQLFAVLVLKNFLQTDYRGVVRQLKDCPDLASVIELEQVPHFTTLQKASRRLLKAASVRGLLDETVRQQMGRRKRVRTAAIDSTGLECTSASGYFVRRRKNVSEKPGKRSFIIAIRNSVLFAISNTISFLLVKHDADLSPTWMNSNRTWNRH